MKAKRHFSIIDYYLCIFHLRLVYVHTLMQPVTKVIKKRLLQLAVSSTKIKQNHLLVD